MNSQAQTETASVMVAKDKGLLAMDESNGTQYRGATSCCPSGSSGTSRAAGPVSAPLQIYFIRHGETAWSLSGQHTGRTDLPLSPHGEAMASELAATLKGIDFSLVLTSPRLRARATCDFAGLGTGAQTEPDLVEWDYGEYEGLRTAEIHHLHQHWDVWEDGCPGGEMPADVCARADHLIARLRDVRGTVALFSHGQFGRALAARWIGLPVAQGQHLAIAPASISILGFETDHPHRRVISLWNSTGGGGVRVA